MFPLFRWIVFAAVAAGTLAGAVLGLAHQVVLVPLIEKAETYEAAAGRADPAAHTGHGGKATAMVDHGPTGAESFCFARRPSSAMMRGRW